jgi:hypothetical protein
MAILQGIPSEYDVPEISPQDDSLMVLLRYHLEIHWKAVHAEILQRLKDMPDLLPQQTTKAYRAFDTFQRKGLAYRRFSSKARFAKQIVSCRTEYTNCMAGS